MIEEWLLAAILGVLVLREVPRMYGWLKVNGRYWAKRWRLRKRA